MDFENPTTRRGSLAKLGGLVVAAAGGSALLSDGAEGGNKAVRRPEDGSERARGVHHDYPGWYQGRAVHIHVKVHVGGNVVHTGQFFFPDALTAQVYEAQPYAARGGPDMSNAHDAIYVNGGKRSLLTVKQSGAGYVGSIAMGVHE